MKRSEMIAIMSQIMTEYFSSVPREKWMLCELAEQVLCRQEFSGMDPPRQIERDMVTMRSTWINGWEDESIPEAFRKAMNEDELA